MPLEDLGPVEEGRSTVLEDLGPVESGTGQATPESGFRNILKPLPGFTETQIFGGTGRLKDPSEQPVGEDGLTPIQRTVKAAGDIPHQQEAEIHRKTIDAMGGDYARALTAGFTGGASLLMDDAPEPVKALGRAVVGGMADTAGMGAGLLSRGAELTGLVDEGSTQALSDYRNAMNAGAQKASSGMVEDAARGVISSLTKMLPATAAGGQPAAIAGFVLDSMNEGYSDARRRGLNHEAALSYAEREGLIEGVVTSAFSMLGLGGAEKAATGAFKGAAKGGLKEVFKQLGAEVLEENITEISHAVNQGLSGIDAEAMTPARVWQTVKDTTLQTLATMGVLEGAKRAGGGERGPSRSEFKAWAQENGVEITGRENAQQRAEIMQPKAEAAPESVQPTVENQPAETALPPTEQASAAEPAVETTPEAPPQDRRQDVAKRKRVSEMTGEEAKAALHTDELTGMKNLRAYDESPRKAHQAFADMDGLKQFNDRFGREQANKALKTVAEAFQEAGVDAYRLEGDEFAHEGDVSQEALHADLSKVQKILSNKVLEFTDTQGRVYRKEGIDLTFGVAKDLAAAEKLTKKEKAAREKRGQRELRSDWEARFKADPASVPRGFSEVAAPGREANADIRQAPRAGPEAPASQEAVSRKQTAAPLPFIGEKPDVEVQGMGMGGEVPPSMLVPRDNGRGLKAVASFLKSNLSGAGDMPKEAFERTIQTRGELASRMTDVQVGIKELERGYAEAYGKAGPTGEQAKAVSDVLTGSAELSSLPESLHEPVRRMRRHLDSLSDEMIKAGVVQGKMAATVEANKGVYLHRSYRSYYDKEWSSRVPDEVVNRAAAFIRSEFAAKGENLDDSEVNGIIHSLLNPNEDSLLSHVGRDAKVGGKDLTMLKHRKGIAPEIRALMGEEQDPIKNYVRSAGKMISAIENHKMLTDMREAGLGKYFFEAKTSNAKGNFTVPLAAEGNKAMSPLDGLYTTKEIADEFRRLRSDPPDWPAWVMTVSGITKASATVGNFPGGHIRNLLGNTGFLVANGHMGSVAELPKALGAIKAQLGNKPGAEIEYVKRLQRLGIIGEDLESGQLRDILRGSTSGAMDLKLPAGRAGESAARKVLSAMSYSYQTMDAIPKIMAFESERAYYAKAYPDWSDTQLDNHASKIVQDTMPTYARASKGIKKLAQLPLMSDFVMFPAEVIRATKNSLALAKQELSRPETRSIGVRRSLGLATQAAFVPALGALSMYLVGVLRDEDDALHEFAPEWSKNADFLYTGRDKAGVPTYLDLSYMDPWQYFRKPINALLKDGPGGAAIEAAGTFASESILTQHVLDVMRNAKKASGGKVYNAQDTLQNKAKAVASHMGRAFTPGSLKSIERIILASEGHVNEYGKQYDMRQELGSLLGNRPQTVNVPEALMFKARAYLRGKGDAEELLRKKLGSKGEVKDKDIKEARATSERARRKLWDDLKRSIWAARKLNLSEDEIENSLEKSMMGKGLIQDIMDEASDWYEEYEPHDDDMQERLDRAMAQEAAG